MSNVKDRNSSGLMLLLTAFFLVALMSLGMSVKVYAARKCDITCTYSEQNGTFKDSFTINDVTPGADAFISYEKIAELISNVTKQTSGNTYGVDKFDVVKIVIDGYDGDDYPLEVDAANERVKVKRAFTATNKGPFIKVEMKNEDFAAYITVTCIEHDQPFPHQATNSRSKSACCVRDTDDDDSSHDEVSAQKPVNPNAILAASFVTADGISHNVKLGPQVQGEAAQFAFRLHTPAGWKEAFTFNMTVNDQADYSLKKGTLSFLIPAQYQKAGRTFALLGIDKDGNVKMFPDTDTKPDTITVSIDIEGYAFELIYFD